MTVHDRPATTQVDPVRTDTVNDGDLLRTYEGRDQAEPEHRVVIGDHHPNPGNRPGVVDRPGRFGGHSGSLAVTTVPSWLESTWKVPPRPSARRRMDSSPTPVGALSGIPVPSSATRTVSAPSAAPTAT